MISGNEIEVWTDEGELKGILGVPQNAKSVVIFAHGSGSSRYSSRNNFVASALQKRGHATLLADLLTEDEELDRRNVFDIDLLARRLNLVKNWLSTNASTRHLWVGFFGASTGAGAALKAAAAAPENIFAVVSRGGRPDLAANALPLVEAPTLLIVGGADYGVIELNQEAFAKLKCTRELKFVPRATHLFEEQGALEAVARLASDWFDAYAPQREADVGASP